jgi:hypothetical protein
LVKMWEKFDDATMGIVVRHIKRFAYPLAPSSSLISLRPARPCQIMSLTPESASPSHRRSVPK